MKTLKGKTRAFRKALRRNGYRGFPIVGAFHAALNGRAILASDIKPGLLLTYVSGPAPEYVAPLEPVLTLAVPDNLPALPTVYKRTEKVNATTGKVRAEYKEAKNPKAGDTVYLKTTTDGGRVRYVEVDFSKLLADLDEQRLAA